MIARTKTTDASHPTYPHKLEVALEKVEAMLENNAAEYIKVEDLLVAMKETVLGATQVRSSVFDKVGTLRFHEMADAKLKPILERISSLESRCISLTNDRDTLVETVGNLNLFCGKDEIWNFQDKDMPTTTAISTVARVQEIGVKQMTVAESLAALRDAIKRQETITDHWMKQLEGKMDKVRAAFDEQLKSISSALNTALNDIFPNKRKLRSAPLM